MTDETAEQAGRERPPSRPRKPYAAPTLVERERLARIAAVPATSGIVTDGAQG